MSWAGGYVESFRRLTGRTPYDYQTRVAQWLEETGEHLLLTAPTGCGKTWATLAPFLHARLQGRPFADRVIYALPLRALANSLKAATERSLRDAYPSVSVTLQTGAEPQDETFNHGDIVFTTIDQLLSSYLHMPLSLPRRLANLNAGAIVGALVVFDEAHLLDPTHALRTMLHLIESHGTLARFVIATATFTTKARQLLLDHVPGMRQEGPTPAETTAIPALATRRRTWTRVGEAVSAEGVRRLHRGDRTIVVVNSVRKAQDIAASLLREPPEGARILVLHSRFFAEDRTSTEAKLAAIFGPDADTTNAILVATQVVEAGMDLSADRLLTEIAPGNALVQRAGRCARYVAPRNTGDVLVFDLDHDSHGKQKLGPYRNGDDRSCLEAAWNALEGAEHAVLGGEGETHLLEASMADSECKIFTTVLSQAEIRRRREDVQRAWGEGDLSTLRLLVRDVRSVSVLLSDNPEAVAIMDGPETISLPTVAWLGFLREVELQGSLRLVQVLEEQADVESPRCVRWTWREMENPDDWADAYCVPGSLAGYHPMMGLLLNPSVGPLPAVRYRHRRPVVAFHYACETYRDHVTRVLRQARGWMRRRPVAVQACAKNYQVSQDLIESVVLLAAGLHDVAKLDRAWQAAGRAWQAHKGRPVSEDVFLAHTDFDPKTDADDHSRPEFRRPPHAVEGALAVLYLVDGWLEDLGCRDQAIGDALRRCVLSGIAHHHAARARHCGDFQLCDGTLEEILGPLLDPTAGRLPVPTRHEILFSSGPEAALLLDEHAFIQPESSKHREMWPLYSFLVRALRLSDQAATREGTGEAVSIHEGS